jgi:predicted HicB family RNase H-like nuclease
MKYKNYEASVTYDEDARIFHGEVLHLRDVITFQGESVNELEQAFHDSVDDYLEFCKERGEKPEKPIRENSCCDWTRNYIKRSLLWHINSI